MRFTIAWNDCFVNDFWNCSLLQKYFTYPLLKTLFWLWTDFNCWNVFYWSKNNIIQYLNHFNLQTKKNHQKQFTSCAYQILSMEWIFCQIIVIPCFALGSFCSQGMQILPPFAFISLTKYLVGTGYYIKCGCSFYVSFYHFVHLVIASLKHISNFLVHQNYPIWFHGFLIQMQVIQALGNNLQIEYL